MGQGTPNLDAGALATMAGLICAFGITVLGFGIQREIQMHQAGQPMWIPWCDRMLFFATEISILFVLLPLLIHVRSFLWVGAVARAACAVALTLVVGYIPAVLAHYRLIFTRRDRLDPRTNPEAGERAVIYATVVLAIAAGIFSAA